MYACKRARAPTATVSLFNSAFRASILAGWGWQSFGIWLLDPLNQRKVALAALKLLVSQLWSVSLTHHDKPMVLTQEPVP